MKKIILFILVLILSGCSSKKDRVGFNVVTSFFPYHSMSEYLVDELVNLENIMPLNMEVHDFEPSPKDLVLLENADLLIVHGAGLEDWLDAVLKSIKNKDLKVLRLSEFVDLNDEDPHTWLSPNNGLIQFTAIKDALVEMDFERSDFYNARFEIYKEQFQDLIEAYQSLESYRGKTIIVDHLAYSYLLNPYGIKQKSVFKSFNSDEASAQDIERIIDLIRQESIHSIFETNHDQSKISDVLIQETGVNRLKLSTLEKSSKSQDYLSLMYSNLASLQKGME